MRLQLNLDSMKKTHGQIEDAVIDDISRLLLRVLLDRGNLICDVTQTDLYVPF